MIARDIGHRSYEEVNLLFWRPSRSAKNTFIEDDASDSDYDYDISTESEERD
jgi:hypothetical protein